MSLRCTCPSQALLQLQVQKHADNCQLHNHEAKYMHTTKPFVKHEIRHTFTTSSSCHRLRTGIHDLAEYLRVLVIDVIFNASNIILRGVYLRRWPPTTPSTTTSQTAFLMGGSTGVTSFHMYDRLLVLTPSAAFTFLRSPAAIANLTEERAPIQPVLLLGAPALVYCWR